MRKTLSTFSKSQKATFLRFERFYAFYSFKHLPEINLIPLVWNKVVTQASDIKHIEEQSVNCRFMLE